MISYRYRLATIFLLAFFLDCLNIFMSTMALPAISLEMGLSTNETTWISHAYILGLTLIMPLSLWFGELLGARKLLTLSMALFALASLLSGFSTQFSALVMARLFQGITGGLMIPVGQAIVFAEFPKTERSKISTMIMVIALIAPAFSPSLGGIILDYASWQWIYFSNIPLALITSFLAWAWIKNASFSKQKSIAQKPDWIGLTLISFSLFLLLTALTQYGQAHQNIWLSHLYFGIGILLFVSYYRYSKKQSNVLVDLSLLTNIRLRASIAVYYAVPGIFTGINFLMIFYLQKILGFTATQTGQLMMLYAFGAFITMMVSGYFYNRIGPKYLLFLGVILHSFGIALLYSVDESLTYLLLIPAYLLMGIGGGLAANVAQTNAMIDFQNETLLKSSVLWNINRQITFCVGIAVLTLIFSLYQAFLPLMQAYQVTFITASLLGLLSLFFIQKLPVHTIS
nr:MFS transporter [Ignatzschineria rhizosphaerae]